MAAIPHLTTSALASRAKLPEPDINRIFDVIRACIEEGMEVRIKGFGSFVPYQRPTASIVSPLINGGTATPRTGGRSVRLRVSKSVLKAWENLKEIA